MGRLPNGVYYEKPDSECSPEDLRRKREAKSRLRTMAAEMARKSDIEHYNAMRDIMDLRSRRRVPSETGQEYYI